MTETASSSPPRLSRFEVNLLHILQFFLGRLPMEQGLPAIRQFIERPPCLSRQAVELIQDTLVRGYVRRLAGGGWQRERFLRDGRPVLGRLWERTAPEDLGLTFSRHALDFLMWFTANNPTLAEDAQGKSKVNWWRDNARELTVADRLLQYDAFASLAYVELAHALPTRMGFPRHGLARLAFPDEFASRVKETPLDLLPWTSAPGACILEALQGELAERWLAVERSKAHIHDGARMQAVGRAQELALDALNNAVEKTQRLDLARFLLVVLHELLTPDARVVDWQGSLRNPGQRFADRAATHRATFILLHQMERLRGWQRQARGVGYFDEGFAAAQLWLAEWEHFEGDLLHQRAVHLLRQVEPLATGGGS